MTKLFNFTQILILVSLIPVSCGSHVAGRDIPALEPPSEEFKNYWFKGKAEISSYQLKQARYGEIRQGKAVMVFVTEDFSRNKQVKLDQPQRAGTDAVKVMKLNLTKKFKTGVYPYSMMQSVFTPVDLTKSPHSLKVTTSSQEWCGHTYAQLNLQPDGYSVQAYSYFESEGDQKERLDQVILEDEIWNRIRIAPDQLPVDKFSIIPNTMTQRLRHTPVEVVRVHGSLKEHNVEQWVYELDFASPERNLKIYFNKEFPYAIQGWEETYRDGFGANAQELTTTATLDRTIISDYWTKNSNADAHLRKELNLE